MSMNDIKSIDWKHFDFKALPSYIVVCMGVAFVGFLLIMIGLLL